MPKINFNTSFVNEIAEPIQRIKFDQKKIKLNTDGTPTPEPMVDADGYIVHENVQIKDLLVQILQMPYPDDKDISFADRAIRGKLARKIATNSTAHYSDAEVTIIAEYSRRNGSTPLLAQIDDLLYRGGVNKTMTPVDALTLAEDAGVDKSEGVKDEPSAA